METKEIVIKVPSDFTDEQIAFIKKSAMLQIEAEMRKDLKIPQEDIDAVEAKVVELREAIGIKIEPVEMPTGKPEEPIK